MAEESAGPGAHERALHPELVRGLLEAIDENAREPESAYEAEALLRDALREGASDIHLDAGLEGILVRVRVDGTLLDAARLEQSQGQRVGNQLRTLARLDPLAAVTPAEGWGSYVVEDQEVGLRISVVPTLHGDKLAVRLIEAAQITRQLEELGLAEDDRECVHQWVQDAGGMLVAAGQTGSGKTTTLYALLERFRREERQVVTLEDPVEYGIPGINQIQVDRRHGLDFPNGVRSMLRLDPDLMLLGEIRDAPSAEAAVDAAASGRALLTTLHARDAVGTVQVLKNLGLDAYQIGAYVRLIIAQRLVRTLCPQCREEGPPDRITVRWLESLGREVPERVWHPVGCEECSGVGYEGRTGIFEVWRLDDDDVGLLLESPSDRDLREHLRAKGHRFLQDEALRKAAAGVTTLEELRNRNMVWMGR